MHANKFYNGLIKHLEDNFWLYIVSLICICTGIVLGIYTVKYMEQMEKTDLINYFLSFTNNINNTEVDNINIFFSNSKK